jgi:hypothetical protein
VPYTLHVVIVRLAFYFILKFSQFFVINLFIIRIGLIYRYKIPTPSAQFVYFILPDDFIIEVF